MLAITPFCLRWERFHGADLTRHAQACSSSASPINTRPRSARSASRSLCQLSPMRGETPPPGTPPTARGPDPTARRGAGRAARPSRRGPPHTVGAAAILTRASSARYLGGTAAASSPASLRALTCGGRDAGGDGLRQPASGPGLQEGCPSRGGLEAGRLGPGGSQITPPPDAPPGASPSPAPVPRAARGPPPDAPAARAPWPPGRPAPAR
jgi:hypothetical protein